WLATGLGRSPCRLFRLLGGRQPALQASQRGRHTPPARGARGVPGRAIPLLEHDAGARADRPRDAYHGRVAARTGLEIPPIDARDGTDVRTPPRNDPVHDAPNRGRV